MRYTVRVSYIDVLGHIWMPNVVASMRYTVRPDDLRDLEGHITSESINDYLTAHTGDFRDLIDWAASIEDGDETLDFDWSSEDNACAYLDTLSCGEDE